MPFYKFYIDIVIKSPIPFLVFHCCLDGCASNFGEVRSDITTDRAEEFNHYGFVIVENVLSDELVEDLIVGFEGISHNDASIRKRQRRTYAIRNLLDEFPAVRQLAHSSSIRALVEPILGAAAFPVRGLLFDKTPEANWKVAWHQDLTIAVQKRTDIPGYGPWSLKAGVQHVQPPVEVLMSMLSVRLHLDDCDEANGPLQVLSGSHQTGKLSAAEIVAWRSRKTAINCCLKRGGALLMRPLLLHASAPSCCSEHRRVIHIEFASTALAPGLKWLDNEPFTKNAFPVVSVQHSSRTR